MSDTRQRVTEGGHAVFDMLDIISDSDVQSPVVQHLLFASTRAAQASRTTNPTNARFYAVEAAARLILAIDLMDAEARP